ncbi:MAG: hypothetical protein Ct9H300mP1_27760 [Planctomycetaceae bacterium]|nr:MAG: hypothetical protein Ct9H300mP1_27760 [Planctomycetaceae bacterium]
MGGHSNGTDADVLPLVERIPPVNLPIWQFGAKTCRPGRRDGGVESVVAVTKCVGGIDPHPGRG